MTQTQVSKPNIFGRFVVVLVFVLALGSMIAVARMDVQQKPAVTSPVKK